MTIRELVTKFGFDVDFGTLNRLNSAINATTRILQAAAVGGSAAVAAAFGLAAASARVGDRLAKTSRRIGVSVQQLREYEHAAKISGVSSDTLATSLERFTRRLGQAREGKGEARRALSRMRISLRDVDGSMRDVDSIFTEVIQTLGQMENVTERNTRAYELFGRQGIRLMEMTADNGRAFERLRAEFRMLSQVWDEEAAKTSEEFNDSMTRMNTVVNALRHTLAVRMMPFFTKWMDRMTDWATKNREVATGLAVLVAALASLATVLTGGAIAWRLFGNAALWAHAKLLLIPALILAIIGLIALLIDDFLVWRRGGKSVIGELISLVTEGFDEIWEDAKALASGWWSDIKNWAEGLASWFKKTVIDPAVDWVRKEISAAWDFLGDMADRTFGEIYRAIKSIIDRIREPIRELFDPIIRAFEWIEEKLGLARVDTPTPDVPLSPIGRALLDPEFSPVKMMEHFVEGYEKRAMRGWGVTGGPTAPVTINQDIDIAIDAPGGDPVAIREEVRNRLGFELLQSARLIRELD